MKVNTKASTFTAVLMLVGLIFLLGSANVAFAEGPPPGQKPGCCTTQDDGGQCVACPEGETCITSQNFCASEEGFFGPGSCFDDGGGASCENAIQKVGCCVVEPGSCVNDVVFESCFFGLSSSSELWVSGASCSDVPQCTLTRNIPTMSNWGLIALAAVFVLVGVWAITRKKAEA